MGLRIKNDARVFVVTGDGEINEGSVEAALSASKHGLQPHLDDRLQQGAVGRPI